MLENVNTMQDIEKEEKMFYPIIDIQQKDRIKTRTAKNFINAFLYKESGSIIKLEEVYNTYTEQLKQLGIRKALGYINFKNLIQKSGYKVDHFNSTRYTASILNLGFNRNADPSNILYGIYDKKSSIKNISSNYDFRLNNNFILDKKEYDNGLQNTESDVIQQPVDFDKDIYETSDIEFKYTKDTNKNKEDVKYASNFENQNEEQQNIESNNSNIYNKVDNVSEPSAKEDNTNRSSIDTEKTVEKKDNIVVEPDILLDSKHVIDFDIDEYTIYNNLLKARINFEMAKQEYEFEMQEFKISKLKLLQKQLLNKNIDKITFNSIVEKIKYEIK